MLIIKPYILIIEFIPLVFIINAFLFGEVFAQPGQPFIRNFSPKENKGHPQNWSAIRDKRGVMYFGNTSGVLEYDGVSWRLIKTTKFSTVRSFAMNQEGTIFVGASNDFGYLSPDPTGKMEFVSLLGFVNPEDREFFNIWKTHSTADGIYFQSISKLFRWKNNKITVWEVENYFHRSEVVRGELYLVQINTGLMKMHNDSLMSIPGGKFFNNGRVYIILPFGDNKMLLGTQKSLFIYNSLVNNDSIITPFETQADSFFLKNQIYSGTLLHDGTYAISTLQGGAAIIDSTGNFKKLLDKSMGLPDNMIFSIYPSEKNLLWLSSGTGISCIEWPSPLTFFNDNLDMKGTILLVKRYQGKIYAASTQGIFYLNDAPFGNNKFMQFKGIGPGVWSILPLENSLLAGTIDNLYEIKNNNIQIIRKGQSTTLYRLSSDTNRIMVGSFNGLYSMYLKNDNWVNDEKISDLKIDVVSMKENKEGKLWVGSRYHNLFLLDFSKGFTANPTIEHYDSLNGLPQSWIYIYTINGREIFAAENGVYQLAENPDINENKTKTYFVMDTLFKQLFNRDSASILPVVQGVDGKIWAQVGEETGFIFIDENGKYQWNPLPFKRVNERTAYDVFLDGNITWSGGYDGMFRYDADIFKDYTVDFNTLIRKVSIGKDSVLFYGTYYEKPNNPDDFNNKLIVSLTQAAVLRPVLSHGFNSIIFEYAALYYENIPANKYQYYLEGFDEDWSDWINENKKEYTNLSEGLYKFRVRAKNIYENISQESSYEFIILPPWYRTVWAYTGYILALIMFIYGIVLLSLRRLSSAKQRLETIVKNRAKEIIVKNNILEKQKNEISSEKEKAEIANRALSDAYTNLKKLEQFKETMMGMIVHDLKNPLNTIIGLSKDKNVKHSMDTIYQAGNHMLHMVLNILEIQRLEEANIKLEFQNFPLVLVAHDAIRQVKLLVKEKNLNIQNNISPKHYSNFDFEIISRVFINLLTNAIKYTPANGKVILDSISYKSNDRDFWKLTVTDTGKGIPPDKVNKVFDKFVQIDPLKTGEARSTGLGLTFCKLVVEAHNGKIWVESEVNKGTTFFFTLPMDSAADSTIHNIKEHAIEKTDEKTMSEELLLSNQEKEYLLPLLQEFEKLEVYDTSYNIKLLNQIKINRLNINKWKEDVINAVLNRDSEKYQQLLNDIKGKL